MARKIWLLLSIVAPVIALMLIDIQPAMAATLIAPMPLISAGLPAYTSDDCFTSRPASYANSGNYSLPWRSCNNPPSTGTPVTLTYDISSIPAGQRSNDVLVWFNDFTTGNYNPTLNSSNYFNTPKDYTVQANTAVSSGTPPSTGWTTLATITGNPYHSLQHVLNLSAYNWVRLSFTSSNGVSPNSDIAISLDLHNASGGLTDDWIFYGDSITQNGLLNDDSNGQTFAQQINTINSNYYPVAESGGIGGFTSSDALSNISTWLTQFPGKFVALNYGTNDANSNFDPNTFYTNMATMVQDIIAAGKTPIIPTIPWGCTANLTANVPTFNAKIQALYAAYPKIIKGPDLYTYFQNNQSYISGADCIHPNATGGWTAYRAQWAQAMIPAVYTAPVATISPSGGNVSSTQTVSLTSTKPGTLYYTTDGSTPTTNSSVYSSAVSISSTTTIKTFAVDQAGNQSDVTFATYTFPVSSGNTSGNNNGATNTGNTHQQTTPSPTTKTSTTSKTIPASTPASTTTSLTTTPATTAAPTTNQARTVILTLSDHQGNPLSNTKVRLDDAGQTATTNAQGVAIFYNVMPGTYAVHVITTRYTGSPSIQVTAGTTAQTISIKLTAITTHSASPWLFGVGTAASLSVMMIIVILLLRRRRIAAES